LELQTVTGTCFYHVKEQPTLFLTTKHGHKETITLNVTPVGRHDIILGLPWCEHHGIQFDWNNKDILAWSLACEGRCFPTPISVLQVKLLCQNAIMPQRGTPGSVGYDLHTTEALTIHPSQRTPISMGLIISLPEGTCGRITPHSSLAIKHSINVATRVIDPDFQGEVKVVLVNNGSTPFHVGRGEHIAQLVLESAQVHDIQQVTTLDDMERGMDRFGSTGMSTKLAEIYAITLGHTASIKI
jgi:dUTP pyrophosphatase